MRDRLREALLGLLSVLMCLGLFVPDAANAIGGEVIDLDRSPQEFIPSFCKIVQRFQKSPDCSGSLIGPNLVVTAAHCVETKEDRAHLLVECGFESNGVRFKPTFKSGVHEIKTDPNYHTDISRAIHDRTFMSQASLDFAILILKRSTSIKPLAVPVSVDEASGRFFQNRTLAQGFMLKKSVECRYAGFGEDTYFKAGSPTVAKLFTGENEKYNFFLSFGTKQENLSSFAVGLPFLWHQADAGVKVGPRNQMLKGDSGGPLVCRESANADWVLIGVNSRTLQPREYFEIVNEGSGSRAKLDLKAGTFEMGFAPTFTNEFHRQMQ